MRAVVFINKAVLSRSLDVSVSSVVNTPLRVRLSWPEKQKPGDPISDPFLFVASKTKVFIDLAFEDGSILHVQNAVADTYDVDHASGVTSIEFQQASP